MSVRNNFFTELAGANMWDVAVAINRGNALPLDRYSVFQSLEEVNAYITNPEGSIAYPGQILAVVGENATTVYYLDQNLAVKPVGVIPSGDSKSIEVTAEGAISILGAATAADGTLPMLENGALVWKTLEQIGAGDGNTLYEFTALTKGEGDAAEIYGFKVQAKNGNENAGDPVEIMLDVYTKSEIDATVGGLDDRIKALEEAEDKDTTYSVKEGDKVLALDGTEFSTTIGLKHENGMISLTGIGGEVIAEFSDADFIKDSVLEDVEYNAETKEIEFTWKTVDGETKTDAVSVADFVQTYTAGNGLELNSNEFAVKIDAASESFLTVGTDGLKLAGVQDAIDTAEGRAAENATSKAAQALADAKTSAAGLYATKEYVGTIPSNYAEKNVIDYINKKAQEVLDSATGGSGESASSVKNQLETYISTNNTRVEGIEKDIEAIEGKLETVEENAQVNVIDTVKVNGTALVVSDKAVDITVPTKLSDLSDYSAIDERINTAEATANSAITAAGEAKDAAAANAAAITLLQQADKDLIEAKNNHAGRIQALETAKGEHDTLYTNLKKTVDQNVINIATKASSEDLAAVSAKASANESAINILNNITIPGLNTEIGKKANADNVYTKAEIGTIAEGKTIVKMIEEAQAAASYNDEGVRKLIGDNAAAIAAIYTAPNGETPASGILATEITRVEELVATEKSRAESIETDHEKRIGDMEKFWEAADDPEGTIDKLAEIVDYINNDTTGAMEMATAIEVNSKAIAAIYTPAEGDKAASGALAVEIERAMAAEKANADAIALINDSTNGILAKANKYTDEAIDNLPFATAEQAGLVKSSTGKNKVQVAADGTMSIEEMHVSINDLFIPEDDELVLDGGGAGGANAQ